MKKILIDLKVVGGNQYNGLYNYCFNLGKSLLKYNCHSFELFYYLPKKKFGIFGSTIQYVAQHSIDKYFKFATSKYSLWHATNHISWYKPFSKKVKFLFTIHDLNFFLEQPTKKASNARKLKLIQKRVDRACHVTFVSNFAYQQACEYLKIQNKPYSIIYPGCSLVSNPIEPETPPFIPNTPFLFSIGLVQTRKNFHVLIPLLLNNNYLLIIAGLNNFDYKNVILETALKYKVNDRIIFTGAISENEKVWYYKNCLAFFFPSIAEGFGLPVIEAMHFGKPVFLSKHTSLPEIGGKMAYYFDNFEPSVMVQNFANGMHHYNTYLPSTKIKKWANNFTYENTAKAYSELYKKLIL